MYYNDEGEDTEITEIVAQEDGAWRVTDEDGEEAVIRWSHLTERWEVDA
jgi:hypothetical protein